MAAGLNGMSHRLARSLPQDTAPAGRCWNRPAETLSDASEERCYISVRGMVLPGEFQGAIIISRKAGLIQYGKAQHSLQCFRELKHRGPATRTVPTAGFGILATTLPSSWAAMFPCF
jgi:hypothetical protein